MTEIAKCEIYGDPMSADETMFKFHGYSGSGPKPPLLQPYQRRVVTDNALGDGPEWMAANLTNLPSEIEELLQG